MTDLAGIIHALAGADRAIDGAVATVLGWWPDNSQEIVNSAFSRLLINEDRIPYGTVNAPCFTASLDATLAEIRRRGWLYQMANSLGSPGNYRLHFNLMTDEKSKVHAVERADRDEALAALEALVRAVEAGE